MPTTRIPQGTASAKASGTTLTIENVTVEAGQSLVVGVGSDNSQGPPVSVTHNGRPFRQSVARDNPGQNIVGALWLKPEYRFTQTGDIVIAWSAPITARAAWAVSFDRSQAINIGSSQIFPANETVVSTGLPGQAISAPTLEAGVEYEIQSAGSSDFTLVGASANTAGTIFVASGPTAGTGVARLALESDDDYALALFVMNGPPGDLAGATARMRIDGSFQAVTQDQFAGTSGQSARSNVTVIEIGAQLSTKNNPVAEITSTTGRRWITGLVALRPRQDFFRVGITPSDLLDVQEILQGTGVNPDNVFFRLNFDTGRWEVYDNPTAGTLVASRNKDGDWI